ncbi:MAG: M43 family zinc metalloprotease [Bacteroidia bacterium]|nr:M43 family zinc metalloprotease [Bacteroidia bacterium]
MRYLILIGAVLWAQRPICWTDQYREMEERAYPQVVHSREQLEAAIATWIEANKVQLRTASACAETSQYVIPVVVHIIHSGFGQPDSLPISRVIYQIQQLFDDYRRRPYSKGYSSGVDTRIEFSLATKDPSGNPHPGVTYTHYSDAGLTSSTVYMNGSQANSSTLKSNVGWPRDRYLNIWVVGRICSASTNCPSDGDVLGFATLPGSFSATDQGVVVVASYFGLPNRSQTTTHENGHYLNLYHTFQNGCTGLTSANCGSQGDRVCDTPPTSQANYGNARRQNTCSENISALGGDVPDQVRNYMDYLDDPSLDIFTEGQAQRMRSTLAAASDRQQWQTANLQQTGTGPWGRIYANFALRGCEQPPCVVCPGQTLNLVSYSMGKPHLFEWQILQGNTVIATSNTGPCATLTAPSTPGTYSIRLRVQNQVASAETTYSGFLVVRDPNVVLSYPFEERFEGTTFPPAGWRVENPDFATGNSNLTWERYNSTGRGSYGNSNGMVRIRNHRYFNRGQRDYLTTPFIAIPTTANNPTISFDLYYRAVNWGNSTNTSLLYGDTLAIYISNDCGVTWQKLYEEAGEDLDVTGSALSSTSTYPTELIPPQGANNNWVRKQVPIPNSYKGTNVLIRFENRTGMGNTLYIDSVRVADGQITTAISKADAVISFAPNPVYQKEGWLRVKQGSGAEVSYRLITLTGQVVQSGQLPSQEEFHKISFRELPVGVYLLQVSVDGQLRWQERVVVVE